MKKLLKRKPGRPPKAIASIVQAHLALKKHRSLEYGLATDVQYYACKALNDAGLGKQFTTRVEVGDKVYAVTVHDRGKPPRGAIGRPRFRYKTEVKAAENPS